MKPKPIEAEFSHEELIKEMLKEIGEYGSENRQAGDIDVNQIAEASKRSYSTASFIMKKLAATGKYRILKVYDPQSNSIKRVLRTQSASAGEES
jgi:hypothetical protein